MSPQLKLADFSNEIPYNNIGIFRSACKSDSGFVEDEFGDGRFVAVKAHNDGRDFAVPKANAAILVADSKNILVGLTLSDASDGNSASFIAPTAQQFSFLNVPAEDLLVRRDNSLANASAGSIVRNPDNVRGARGDQAKSFGMLVLSAVVVSIMIVRLCSSRTYKYDLTILSIV